MSLQIYLIELLMEKVKSQESLEKGMSNLGTINKICNAPKSQITKDMILDYQDEQQQNIMKVQQVKTAIFSNCIN